MYLWPAATNVVARRPHQSKGVKRILVYESAFANRQHSGNFFCFLTKQQQRKLRRKLIQLWTSFITVFGPSGNKE
ncbi:hypothetical protein CXF78_20175 [Shewanella sp. 11B5]|nr:hypothetical protein CXF78_20175 [Shewanella sp. 11B5]